MATFRNRLLQMEWLFHEHGMDCVWNELFKAAESTLGSGFTGVPGGVVKLGDIDFAITTHLTTTATIPNTGAPIPAGVQNPGWNVTNVTNPGTVSGGTNLTRPPVANEP